MKLFDDVEVGFERWSADAAEGRMSQSQTKSRGRPKMVESQGGCFDIGSVGYQKEAVLLERRGWLGRMAEVGRDDGITETR